MNIDPYTASLPHLLAGAGGSARRTRQGALAHYQPFGRDRPCRRPEAVRQAGLLDDVAAVGIRRTSIVDGDGHSVRTPVGSPTAVRYETVGRLPTDTAMTMATTGMSCE